VPSKNTQSEKYFVGFVELILLGLAYFLNLHKKKLLGWVIYCFFMYST